MTDQQIQFSCASCGAETTISTDEQDDHTVDEKLYCKTCIGPTAWESQDFPLWIEVEHYNDNYQLGRAVEHKTGIDIEDIPIARDLKYCVVHTYWKITENGVEGPYNEKEGSLL